MAQTDPQADRAAGNVIPGDRLSLLKSRLSVAKSFCKLAHDTWRYWINEYNIDDIPINSRIKDKARVGYIFRKIESELPSIFDDQPQIFIKGRTEQVKQIEPFIMGVYDYLWDTQRLDEKIEDLGLYFELLGMGYLKSPWVTKSKKVVETKQNPVLDEMGQPTLNEQGQPNMVEETQEYYAPTLDQPMAEVPNPFKVYFSPETKFAIKLDAEHCPYYFEEQVLTKEEVKARFDKDVEPDEIMKVDSAYSSKKSEPVTGSEEHSTVINDDIKRVTTYEYYGTLPEEFAKDIKDREGKPVPWEYDRDYHIWMTSKEELMAEDCPYESKPLMIVGNYGLANQFFKFGEAKHLIPLVQEYEQYRSQILTHTRKIANPKPMVPTTANIDEQAFMDPRSGRVVKYDGPTAPTYMIPGQLGKEVTTGIQMVQSDLERTAASFSLASGSDSSQVKTPRGIQVYSEAADKVTVRKRRKFARFIRELIVFQFQQCGANWKPDDQRVISIISEGQQNMQQVTPEVIQVLSGVQIYYNLDIEVESLSINKTQVKQDALNLLDLATQHPQTFNMDEIAKYVLENGFTIKDADRFLLTPEQKQQMAENKPDPASVNVSVKADAGTPIGAKILEDEGVIPQGMAQAVTDPQATIDDTGVPQGPAGPTRGQMALQPPTVPQQQEGGVQNG